MYHLSWPIKWTQTSQTESVDKGTYLKAVTSYGRSVSHSASWPKQVWWLHMRPWGMGEIQILGRGCRMRHWRWRNQSHFHETLQVSPVFPPPPFPPAQLLPLRGFKCLAWEQGAQVTAPPTLSSLLRYVLQWAGESGAAMKDPVASLAAAVGATKWLGTWCMSICHLGGKRVIILCDLCGGFPSHSLQPLLF